MAQIKTAFYPKRKTKNFNQWIGYIYSKSKELKGINKHEKFELQRTKYL